VNPCRCSPEYLCPFCSTVIKNDILDLLQAENSALVERVRELEEALSRALTLLESTGPVFEIAKAALSSRQADTPEVGHMTSSVGNAQACEHERISSFVDRCYKCGFVYASNEGDK